MAPRKAKAKQNADDTAAAGDVASFNTGASLDNGFSPLRFPTKRLGPRYLTSLLRTKLGFGPS